MATKYVSGSNQLKSALASAKSGDTIVLANGNYGKFDFDNLKFTKYVTIKSAKKGGAKFQEIEVDNSKYLKFDGIHVNSNLNTGNGRLFEVLKSDHITIQNSEVNGKVDGNYSGLFGIYFNDKSTNVTVQNNNVHDVLNAYAFFGVSNLTVKNNKAEHVGSDAFKFGTVKKALIEDNVGPVYMHIPKGGHADFMQFQGAASSNVTIRGNVFMPKQDFHTQGIFMAGNGKHSNVLIEENIIYTGMANGIVVNAGSNVRVLDNTVLNVANDPSPSVIKINGNATVKGNIWSERLSKYDGKNLIIQDTDKKMAHHYEDIYKSVDGKKGITIKDLTPVKGSLGEKFGAVDKIKELLGQKSSYTPTKNNNNNNNNNNNDNDAVMPTVSKAVPPKGDELFSLSGDHEFRGRASDVKNYSHKKYLEVDQATISFSFEADKVNKAQGLLSKDAAHFVGGGNHFTSYIKAGKLYVRFQDEDSSKTFVKKGIKANKEYDFQATFDGKNVSVWLDDALVGKSRFDTDWSENDQYMQIGANGWASGDNRGNYKDFFDGTISNVSIYDDALTPRELDLIA